MKKKLPLVVIALLLCLGCLLFFFLRGRGAEQATEEDALQEVPLMGEDEGQKVFLYFTSRDGLHLVATTARIGEDVSREEKVRQVFELLRRGPAEGETLFPVLASETILENVFLGSDGCLYLNFGPEISEGHPGGSAAETLSVYAIVNSLVESFAWVEAVRFLLNGEEMETLMGHVNLCEKMTPRDDIIALIEEKDGMGDVQRELDRDVIR